MGCHYPHPSNPNQKYLRVDTAGGADMAKFCSLCHSSKSGKPTPASQMFSSMNEQKKTAPARKAPAKKK